jgi:V8-like Glu-specific endopeptidase
MKLRPNELTGKLPGEVQGFLPVKFDKVRRGAMLKMYGYGASSDPQGNCAQQLSVGKLKKIKSNGLMYHKMDAASGSSGSAILLEGSDEIIGVHTHNGCQELLLKGNRATAISKNPAFAQAIRECLTSEE